MHEGIYSIVLALRFGRFPCFLYMPGACVGIRISPALGHTHRLIANDGDPKSSKPLGSCLGNIHFPASPTLGTLVPLQPLQLCCSGVLPLGAVTFPRPFPMGCMRFRSIGRWPHQAGAFCFRGGTWRVYRRAWPGASWSHSQDARTKRWSGVALGRIRIPKDHQ